MSLRRAASVSAARALTLDSMCWASSRALSVVMGSALRGFLVLAVVVNQQPLSHPAARAGVASAALATPALAAGWLRGCWLTTTANTKKPRRADPMTTDKARELAQHIESSVNALAAETDAARRSDIFRGWLNAMAQFHNYSWNNQLLISMQCPTATRVAGFHTWRKMNRFVRKGEKGITILAPCIYKPKKSEQQQGEEIEQQTHGIGTLCGFR